MKVVGCLDSANVLVVALSNFIVESDYALTVHNIREPVLEVVPRGPYRLRDAPNHNLGKCVICENDSAAR
jgi:hypothetical protein